MQRASVLLLLGLLGCRRTAPQEAKPEQVASASAGASTSAAPSSAPSIAQSAAPSIASSPVPSSAPLPTPPAAACATHPDLRWDADATHPLMRDLRSPGGYTLAPGTLAILAHAAFVPGVPEPGEDLADARTRATTALSLRYSAVGLPKGATIDAATGEVTYRVALASGEAAAFTVVATATADPAKRCLTTGVVLQALDDDDHRIKQATWIARELWGERASAAATETAKAKSIEDPDAGEHELEKVRNEAWARLRPHTDYKDLDGDGQKDVVLTYGPAYDNDIGATLVLVRRKDTFFPFDRIAASSLDVADDGTPLLVSKGGCCCHRDLLIHRVFSNRVQSIANVDLAGNCSDNTVDIDLVRGTAGGILAYALVRTIGGKSTRELWKWNGKGFVIAP
ncbi:MAG: hypothetical protein IPJ34_38530 [Myxococcales bacterium]|nr:hypothetical protein [Myxococcales bacterium]